MLNYTWSAQVCKIAPSTIGELVTVNAPRGPYFATASADGTWSTQLDPPGPPFWNGGAPCNISVSGSLGGPTIVAKDVVYGDVWLCAGGSMVAADSSTSGLPLPKLPSNLRLFTMQAERTTAGSYNASTVWLSSAKTVDRSGLAASSRLCLLAAAKFIDKFPNPATRKIGIIVSAVVCIDTTSLVYARRACACT